MISYLLHRNGCQHRAHVCYEYKGRRCLRFSLTNNTLTMWSILSILATLSLASASPVFRRDDGENENLDDNDNEISCVKYKFSGESAC